MLFLQAKAWIDSYTKLRNVHASYRPQYVTPYMHVLAYHVPHLIRHHGNIKQFSCQDKDFSYLNTTEINKCIYNCSEEE